MLNPQVQFGRVTHVSAEKMQTVDSLSYFAHQESDRLKLEAGDDNPLIQGMCALASGDRAMFSNKEWNFVEACLLYPGEQGVYFVSNTDSSDYDTYDRAEGLQLEKFKTAIDQAKADGRVVLKA